MSDARMGWVQHPRTAGADAVEIDLMIEALVDTLQPFAQAGGDGLNAMSALVSVLCAVAGETCGGAAKYVALTDVIELLKEQAEEWSVRDCAPPCPGVGA